MQGFTGRNEQQSFNPASTLANTSNLSAERPSPAERQLR